MVYGVVQEVWVGEVVWGVVAVLMVAKAKGRAAGKELDVRARMGRR